MLEKYVKKGRHGQIGVRRKGFAPHVGGYPAGSSRSVVGYLLAPGALCWDIFGGFSPSELHLKNDIKKTSKKHYPKLTLKPCKLGSQTGIKTRSQKNRSQSP